jgi:hypothetical protein
MSANDTDAVTDRPIATQTRVPPADADEKIDEKSSDEPIATRTRVP